MTSPPYWGKREYESGGIGLEDDYGDFVRDLAAIFSELKRALTPEGSGTLFGLTFSFQNVFGCQLQSPSPTGLLIDSTASALSHEVFETITDLQLNAWFNDVSLILGGAEIGNECQNLTFGYGSVFIHDKEYQVQPEYSNGVHGCTFSPTPRPQAGGGDN
jgi:hypothetical protein